MEEDNKLTTAVTRGACANVEADIAEGKYDNWQPVPMPPLGRLRTLTDNYGCRVRLVLRSGEMTLRNVTEIHYMHNPTNASVAFESDIHGTGRNEKLADVLEFETRIETSVADNF